MCTATFKNEDACAGDAGSATVEELASKSIPADTLENTPRKLEVRFCQQMNHHLDWVVPMVCLRRRVTGLGKKKKRGKNSQVSRELVLLLFPCTTPPASKGSVRSMKRTRPATAVDTLCPPIHARVGMRKQGIHKKLLAESLIVFHDKRTSSRQLATQIMVRMVGRLAVVQGEDFRSSSVECRGSVSETVRGALGRTERRNLERGRGDARAATVLPSCASYPAVAQKISPGNDWPSAVISVLRVLHRRWDQTRARSGWRACRWFVGGVPMQDHACMHWVLCRRPQLSTV